VKIVPRVGPFNHHDEKIAAVIEITIAYRRFEFLAVFFDPILQINRRFHSLHHAERIGTNAQRQTDGEWHNTWAKPRQTKRTIISVEAA
jgi:hypothetical protein